MDEISGKRDADLVNGFFFDWMFGISGEREKKALPYIDDISCDA